MQINSTNSKSSPSPSPVTTAVELALENFSYTPIGRREPVLKALNLKIPAGQKVLLTGNSGSGKSTLLKALAGLIPADGTHSEIIHPVPTAALMVQNPLHSFVGAAAGLDTSFAPENQAVPQSQIPARVHQAVHAAQFTPGLERSPYALSGGQQQRLSLAGILATNAGALLLDEPVTMLDAATADGVRAAIIAAAAGRTLVVADHHFEPWLGQVDRVLHFEATGELLDFNPADFEQKILAASVSSSEALGVGAAPDSDAETKSGAVLLQIPATATLGGEELLAESIGLTIRAGELTVLTGLSGVGKSSYLRHVLESSRVSSGKQSSYRAAWLPQNPEQAFVAPTALLEVQAGNPELSSETAQEFLEQVQVAHLAAANPFALSGGEQRRLAFASALAAKRQILVLDEPTVGLDQNAYEQVWDLIQIALKQGVGVLAATHDPRLIAAANKEIQLEPHPARQDFWEASAKKQKLGEHKQHSPIPQVPFLPRKIPTDLLNPLTIMLVATCAFIGSFWVRSIEVGLLSALLTLLLIPLTFRTLKHFLMRIIPITLGALMVGWSVVLLSPGGITETSTWQLGASEALRIFAMVAPGALMLESIEATRLGQALAQRLKVPARFAATMIVGLSRMGHLFSEWNAILYTRKVRGIHQKNPFKLYAGATFALLVSTLRSAEVQAFAMDARGFTYAQNRTWTHSSTASKHDLWGALIALLVLLTPIISSIIF